MMMIHPIRRSLMNIAGLSFLTTSLSGGEPGTTYRKFTTEERDGRIVSMSVLADPTPPRWARDVAKKRFKWPVLDPAEPHFEGPIPFVIPPVDKGEPFYNHNHQPSVTWLDNGDLLAIWYSTKKEKDTGLTVLASRLRAGQKAWDPASEFFKAANHNMQGSTIFRTKDGTIHHLNGVGPVGVKGWKRLAFVMRSSSDEGITWTAPHACGPEFKARHQVISGTIITRNGTIIQCCDAVPGPEGGTAIQISRDAGKTWFDPGEKLEAPEFRDGTTGRGTIAGIHAGIVELSDGRLMALGRRNNINGFMPRSISTDNGKTWTYSASRFPPISGGQRLVLKRLREGPLLMVSFTAEDHDHPRSRGLEFADGKGGHFTGYGMYAALSMDDGKTWPIRRLLTPGSGKYDGGAWTGTFTATADQAEPAGYLACTQTPDGTIHLLSSRLHYRFNVAWLNERKR